MSRSGWKEQALPLGIAALAALVLGAWLMQGVLLEPLTRAVDSPFTDGHLVGAQLGVDALFSGELWELRTSRAVYPEGAHFRPLLWPLLALSAVVGPILALNLTWGLIPLFNVLGGFLLGRAAGATPAGAALTGALLAWLPWVRVTLSNGQVEQSVLGALALVWAASLWAGRGSVGRVLLPALVVGAVGLATPHAALGALLGLPLVLLPAAWEARRSPAELARLALLLGLCALVALGVSGYHSANFDGEPNLFHPRLGKDATHYSNAPLGELFFVPGQDTFEDKVVHCVYLGAPLLLAGLGALLRFRRSWSWVAVASWCAVLALGPAMEVGGVRFILPMAMVEAAVPSLTDNGSGYRLVMGALVGLAAAVGMLAGSGRRSAALAVVLVALSWGETSLIQAHHIPFPTRPAVHHPELAVLRGVPGSILDLPVLRRECSSASAHWLNSALVHDMPFLHDMGAPGLYAVQPNGDPSKLSPMVQKRCAPGLEVVFRRLGVGAVVVHDDECADVEALQSCLRSRLGEAPISGPELEAWIIPPGKASGGPRGGRESGG